MKMSSILRKQNLRSRGAAAPEQPRSLLWPRSNSPTSALCWGPRAGRGPSVGVFMRAGQRGTPPSLALLLHHIWCCPGCSRLSGLRGRAAGLQPLLHPTAPQVLLCCRGMVLKRFLCGLFFCLVYYCCLSSRFNSKCHLGSLIAKACRKLLLSSIKHIMPQSDSILLEVFFYFMQH